MNKDNWVRCPKCRTKLFILNAGGISKGIIIKCKRCKNILEVNIDKEANKEIKIIV